MKTKKILAMLLSAMLAIGVLSGCGDINIIGVPEGNAPVENKPVESTPEEKDDAVVAEGAVKTGLSFVATTSSSKDASAEGDGVAQTDVTLVAVAVDDNGVITDCVIDQIKAVINFSAEGVVLNPEATFESKNVLGTDYGMSKASSIGKEWNEQAAAVADFAVGKTVEELKGVAVNESGMAADADLAASATMYIGNFISGIEDAANNAEHRGAKAGEKLALVSTTNASSSKDASDKDGVATAYTTVAVVTLDAQTVTSCYIDAAQAKVSFDAAGKITSDVNAEVLTKNALGADYGMGAISSIGKEWNEQAAAFSAYVTGKSLDEVTGIALTETTAPAEDDLRASVTISIGDFKALFENLK